MHKNLLAGSAMAVLLALAACSSSDDDSGSDDGDMTAGEGTLGGESGPGDSSQFNPDLDSGPPDSGPGDDATAIAGLWDSSQGTAVGERYVEITTDGRYSEYTADADGGNCYEIDGPYTMELEIEASNEWSTSNGLSFVATSDTAADPRMLDIQYREDGDLQPAQSWPLSSGVVVDDIQNCDTGTE